MLQQLAGRFLSTDRSRRALRRWAEARSTGTTTHHDTQETRVGDIPHSGRRYPEAASNERVTADQASAAPPSVAAGVQRVVDEYGNGDSLEVVVAHDADKLDCLIQAAECREQ